jgi:SH3-like domain-containing protein
MAARWSAIILLGLLLLPRLAAAAATDDNDVAGGPLPRFASMRSDKVNLRTGPGQRYPIEWVLVRRDMPVEVIGEFEHWRHIRDWQGTEGWVQERMIGAKREVIVTGATHLLHSEPDAGSAVVARAEPGVIARLISCRQEWCNVEANDVSGWIARGDVFGVLPNEAVP